MIENESVYVFQKQSNLMGDEDLTIGQSLLLIIYCLITSPCFHMKTNLSLVYKNQTHIL